MAEKSSQINPADEISFGEVARYRCGMQCQYAVHYLAGTRGSPALGEDLRWSGDTADYHFVVIHKDDADVFVKRLRESRIQAGCGWSGEDR